MSKYKVGDLVVIQPPKDEDAKLSCDWIRDMDFTTGLVGTVVQVKSLKDGVQRYGVKGVYSDGDRKGRQFGWSYTEELLKSPSKFRVNQGKRRRKKLGLAV